MEQSNGTTKSERAEQRLWERNANKKKGRIVYRTTKDKFKVHIRQVKKSDIVAAKARDRARIDFEKLIPTKKGMMFNIKAQSTKKKASICNTIFEHVLLKIMGDMVEHKNIYLLPNGAEFCIATMVDSKNVVRSFFTFDTINSKNPAVINSEAKGYAWRIMPNKKVGLKLKEYTDKRKYKYKPCKQLLGRQLRACYRDRLNSLMSKQSKSG